MNDTKSTKKLYSILTAIILVITTIIVILLTNNNTNKVIVSNEESNQLINTNALTMMYETEYHSGEYQVSSDITWPKDGYVFNEQLSKCENGSSLTWNDENKKVIMQANTSDKCYIYFDKESNTLADYIINNVYVEDGVNGLYYHDGVGSYINADQEAGDNSYRYAGANPNNYMCFGTDAATCPNDNLYRIIGVFGKEVKLIKDDYANSDLLGTNGNFTGETYANFWGTSSYYKGNVDQLSLYLYYNNNTWSENQLNTLNLNTNYLNSLESKWNDLMENHMWQAGGNTYASIINTTVKNTYQNEIVSPAEAKTYSAKIGLMYVSDYGYAASPENWNTTLYNYDNDTNKNNNWMYMGLNEWTITDRSDYSHNAFDINEKGNVNHYSMREAQRYAVRPSFYIKSTTVYVSGTGTQSDPFRIA